MTFRFIFFDLETTGLSADSDRIIEIAAYDPANGKKFSSLVNPGRPLLKETIELCNITDEMVTSAPSFSEAAVEFSTFCSGEVVLVAHNGDSFDRPFLEQEFKQAGIPFPKFHFFDTLKWARKYRSDLPRHSLQYLREIYQIPANNAHRALDDVLILHQVFSRMTQDLSLNEIISLLSKKNEGITMPFGKYQGLPLKEVPASYIQWLDKNGSFQKEENRELKKNLINLGLLKP